jgi:predicted HD phosphohydrolase
MDANELQQFQAEPYCQQALQLRRWDDLAKDPLKATPSLEAFVVHLQACLLSLEGR